ncbi:MULTISPECIES: tyrosine-type recombinase/integrase [unclassified Nostoc]|uniref:tyrosine-type recombinase/integrase n=1 Tax=unclassified Nostoc TaxID=2593658 RepID=UPI002AD35221|nr:tyrosine-type recombinase/integrase [Nostoc sp. DedQUE03]MDZ7975761.1 tyrosine-type recombinase/integrase [Nostoc sp. DedQUE03]MDZ8048293.1 tyrosine-type recombinase/integrase [Nostoc sp. DedQUE02]
MPKNNRIGKAAVITDAEYSKIRRKILTEKYKLLLDLGWFTGECWGALVKLRVSDVYDQPGIPKTDIIFPAIIRKHRPDGTADTTEIPVHPTLKESLERYEPKTSSEWLFPSRCGTKPIVWKNAYNILMAAVEKAGYEAKGISTHTMRRSFVNRLRRNGIEKEIIRTFTGHRDNKGLDPYFEIEADERRGAIATL